MPSKTCSNNAVGFIFRTLQQRSLFFLFLPVFGPIAGALSRGWPIKVAVVAILGTCKTMSSVTGKMFEYSTCSH